MGASRRSGWWPLLALPAVVALGLAARPLGYGALLAKPPHELIAPPILALVVLICARRALVANDLLFAWLTALAAIFLLREIHFRGSNTITYVGLLGLAAWAAIRRPALLAALRGWRGTPWLMASLSCYVFSQVVARRAFRGLPGERQLHVGMEELLETAAHLLFLLTAILAARTPRGAPADTARTEPAAQAPGSGTR